MLGHFFFSLLSRSIVFFKKNCFRLLGFSCVHSDCLPYILVIVFSWVYFISCSIMGCLDFGLFLYFCNLNFYLILLFYYLWFVVLFY